MKIKFDNFRYYESKTLEIPDEGVFLLHGDNGTGKSTILKGISHAFFGNIDKPYRHGKKECTVQLEYKDLNIKRHNNPSFLIVYYKGDKYEGKSAQGVINDYLGLDKNSFASSSWFKDPIGSAIISLPPCEQLQFIEKIIFENSNSRKYLDYTNLKIKRLKDEIIHLEGEISAYENELSTNEVEPIEKEYIDEIKENINSLREQDEEYSSTIEDCTNVIEMNRQKIKKLTNELHRQEKVRKKITMIDNNITSLEEELSNLSENVMSEEELEDNENKICSVRDEIFNLECYSKYQEYLQDYKKLKDDYQSEKNSKLLELKKQLEEFGSSSELREELKNQKNPEDYLTMLRISFSKFKKIFPDEKINSTKKICSFLSEKIDEKIDILQELQNNLYKSSDIYQSSHNCPSCNNSLVFQELELVLGEEIQDAEFVIQKYQKELRLKHYLEFILKDIRQFSRLYHSSKNDDLRDNLQKVENIERKIIDIENQKLPRSILEFKNKVLDMKKTVPKGFKFEGDTSLKISDLKDELDKFNDIKNIGWIERSNFIRKNKTLKSLKIELSKYEKSINSECDYNIEIEKLEKENEEMNKTIFQYQNYRTDIITELRGYSGIEQHIKDYEKYMKLKNILDNLNHKYDEVNILCRSHLRFRECLKKAKLVAVEDIINILNHNSKKYLDSMFTEPIDIRLYIDYSSDTLKIKNKMIFNGEIYSKLSDFSHGERQKIVLCFLLALNDCLGSQILMLDESFTNIDYDKYLEVISFLKDVCNDKLVIVVSQKICKGIFDKHFHFNKIF